MSNLQKLVFGGISVVLLGLSAMTVYDGIKRSPNLAAQFLEKYPLKN